jgi:hypothetical protein
MGHHSHARHAAVPQTVRTGMTDSIQVLGALALELAPGSAATHPALPQAAAGELAQHVARDLAGFFPDAASLELVAVAAHYDAVELLRPGWPLHRELDQLAARAPAPGHQAVGGGRVIAFGTHEGRLPGALAPSPDFEGGPMRLLPFVLGGDAGIVARVGDAFERDLLERGMAGAATALFAQEAFGLRVEHARYLTAHDLLALVAVQYEHAGLAPLWPLLEAALLAPAHAEWLDAPPEPLLRQADGEVRMALFDAQAWKAHYAADADCGDAAVRERLARAHARFEARERQYTAVLQAHGIPVTFVHCPAGADAREALRA